MLNCKLQRPVQGHRWVSGFPLQTQLLSPHEHCQHGTELVTAACSSSSVPQERLELWKAHSGDNESRDGGWHHKVGPFCLLDLLTETAE